MNKFVKRLIGNALTGFVTGFVSVAIVTSSQTIGLYAGIIAGLLQALAAIGKEFTKSGSDDKANPKGSSTFLLF